MSLEPDERARLVSVARRSYDVIVANQHPSGAYPASPTFSAYRGFSWLRDGAFIAEGISRYGDAVSASAFHDWVGARLCERRADVDVLTRRRLRGEVPPPEAMLPTRFAMDPTDIRDGWWNFQTDGYGTWLWAVITHAARHGVSLQRWRDGIQVAVDYTTAFWDVPCYDWWEENIDRVHGSTLGALYGGLAAFAGARSFDAARQSHAAQVAAEIQRRVLAQAVAGSPTRLAKWVGSDAVDASLASSIVPFGLLEPADPVASATLAEISRQLDVGGGVHRYAADVFYGGGQWPLLSCLLGWNEAVAGRTPEALNHLRWVAAHLTEGGHLPEQVPDHLLHPEHKARWEAEWGPVATPLLWSHGMYLILADELGLTSTVGAHHYGTSA